MEHIRFNISYWGENLFEGVVISIVDGENVLWKSKEYTWGDLDQPLEVKEEIEKTAKDLGLTVNLSSSTLEEWTVNKDVNEESFVDL